MNLIKNVISLCLVYSMAMFTAHGAAFGASQLILGDLRNALLQGSRVNGTEFAQLAESRILPNAKLIPSNSSDKRTLFSAFILTQKLGNYASIARFLTDSQLNDEILLLQSLGQFHLWFKKNHEVLKLIHADLQSIISLQKKARDGHQMVGIPVLKDSPGTDLLIIQKLITAGKAGLK